MKYFIYKTGEAQNSKWHMIPEGKFTISNLDNGYISLDIIDADERLILADGDYLLNSFGFSKALRLIKNNGREEETDIPFEASPTNSSETTQKNSLAMN